VGDVVRLVEGEAVPADGVLLDTPDAAAAGAAVGVSVDESMLTGEPALVPKAPGAALYGGTVVVDSPGGAMVVTACGDNSALGRILSMVQTAQVRCNVWV
jgi:cation transport ATPase